MFECEKALVILSPLLIGPKGLRRGGGVKGGVSIHGIQCVCWSVRESVREFVITCADKAKGPSEGATVSSSATATNRFLACTYNL